MCLGRDIVDLNLESSFVEPGSSLLAIKPLARAGCVRVWLSQAWSVAWLVLADRLCIYSPADGA